MISQIFCRVVKHGIKQAFGLWLINPANRINAGFDPCHLCFCMESIPQKRHCFRGLRTVKITLCLCALMGFVALRVANNLIVAVKDKKHN